MKKKIPALWMVMTMALMLAACGSDTQESDAAATTDEEAENEEEAEDEEAGQEPVTILVAAAASLEYSYVDELIPMFTEQYPWITVEGTYDSSGKLQTQIEEGLEADVFMSAATTQMDELTAQELIDESSVVDLLENKIVLIVPAESETGIDSFEKLPKPKQLRLVIRRVFRPDSMPRKH